MVAEVIPKRRRGDDELLETVSFHNPRGKRRCRLVGGAIRLIVLIDIVTFLKRRRTDLPFPLPLSHSPNLPKRKVISPRLFSLFALTPISFRYRHNSPSEPYFDCSSICLSDENCVFLV